MKQVVRKRLQTVILMRGEWKKVEFDKESQRAAIRQFLPGISGIYKLNFPLMESHVLQK